MRFEEVADFKRWRAKRVIIYRSWSRRFPSLFGNNYWSLERWHKDLCLYNHLIFSTYHLYIFFNPTLYRDLSLYLKAWSGWTLPSLEQSCLALRDYDYGDLSTHLLEATQHILDYISGRPRWARHLDHHWSCLHLWLRFERKRDILHDCCQGSWLLAGNKWKKEPLVRRSLSFSKKRKNYIFLEMKKGFTLAFFDLASAWRTSYLCSRRPQTKEPHPCLWSCMASWP